MSKLLFKKRFTEKRQFLTFWGFHRDNAKADHSDLGRKKLQFLCNSIKKVTKVERGARGCLENKTAIVQNYANKVHIGLYYENGRELTLTLISRHLYPKKMAILVYFSKMSHV